MSYTCGTLSLISIIYTVRCFLYPENSRSLFIEQSISSIPTINIHKCCTTIRSFNARIQGVTFTKFATCMKSRYLLHAGACPGFSEGGGGCDHRPRRSYTKLHIADLVRDTPSYTPPPP